MSEKLHELDWCKILWHHVEENWENTRDLILGYPGHTPGKAKVAIGRERRLWDGTRVDILTENYAVEVDWSYKWTEAVGQSMYYSTQTDRKPGIVLLVKNFYDDLKYIHRCKIVCEKLDIKLWMVDCKDFEVIDESGAVHKLRRPT